MNLEPNDKMRTDDDFFFVLCMYVSDFRQIHDFRRDSSINAHRHYKSVILLKMALSTTSPNHNTLIYVYRLSIYANYIVLYRMSR